MAQFKYVGHEQGLSVPPSGLITIRGRKKHFAGGGDNNFEIQVQPGETFDIPDEWQMAVAALEQHKNPLDPSKKLYERIS